MPSMHAPGWYGKLPSLGDFASRRVDDDFLQAWDGWLAHDLAGWRSSDPQGWLQRYLRASSCLFLAVPGALGHPHGALAGVLTPSVDRVGRYFPLTLHAALPRLPRDEEECADLLGWLLELDDVAVQALQDDWPIPRLEDELLGRAPGAPSWCGGASRAADAAGPQPGPAAADAPARWARQWTADREAQPCDQRIWWFGTDDDGSARLRGSQGLEPDWLPALLGAHVTDDPAGATAADGC